MIKASIRSKWLEKGRNKDKTHNIVCPFCGSGYKSKGHANSYYTMERYVFCPHCGKNLLEVTSLQTH